MTIVRLKKNAPVVTTCILQCLGLVSSYFKLTTNGETKDNVLYLKV